MESAATISHVFRSRRLPPESPLHCEARHRPHEGGATSQRVESHLENATRLLGFHGSFLISPSPFTRAFWQDDDLDQSIHIQSIRPASSSHSTLINSLSWALIGGSFVAPHFVAPQLFTNPDLGELSSRKTWSAVPGLSLGEKGFASPLQTIGKSIRRASAKGTQSPSPYLTELPIHLTGGQGWLLLH